MTVLVLRRSFLIFLFTAGRNNRHGFTAFTGDSVNMIYIDDSARDYENYICRLFSPSPPMIYTIYW